MVFSQVSKRSLFLLMCDIGAIALAYVLGFYLRGWEHQLLLRAPFLSMSFIVFPLFFYIFDLYYPFKHFKNVQTVIDVVLSVTLGITISAAAFYADRTLVLPRSVFLFTAPLLIIFILLIRLCYDMIFRSRFLDKRTLVLGTDRLAIKISKLIRSTPHSGIEIIGMVSEKGNKDKRSVEGFKVIGSVHDIISLIDWYNIQMVVLALGPKQTTSEMAVVSDLLQRKVIVSSSIHLFEKLSGTVPYKDMSDHFLLGLVSRLKKAHYLKVKRIIDLVVSSVLLLCISPVLFLAMIALAFSDPKRVFFSQKRVGKDGRVFQLYKLRSMTKTKQGKQVVTRLGKWIRKYRLDETPQLINVLKGDMSLIGPRPEMEFYVNRSRKRIPFFGVMHAVKPGLTGWAQINQRHSSSIREYETKFAYNLYYLKNLSLKLDILVAFKTIRVVVLGLGK